MVVPDAAGWGAGVEVLGPGVAELPFERDSGDPDLLCFRFDVPFDSR